MAGKLLRSLLAVADPADVRPLVTLCRDRREQVAAAFKARLTPPVPDRKSVRRLARLVGPDRANPFARWEAKIDQSLSLMRDAGDFRAAADVLSDHLIDERRRRNGGRWPRSSRWMPTRWPRPRRR